jgi:glucan phosphoethanolaminetransferase (alkaline phosphatase superfamily)
MSSQTAGRNWLNRILVLLVILNILGDISNIAVWLATPSSRGFSLNTGYIADKVGSSNALVAGSAILLIVALCYAVAAFGLSKKRKWAPLLVIAVSVVNRLLTLVIYVWNIYFFLFLAWTIILIIVTLLDYRKISVKMP